MRKQLHWFCVAPILAVILITGVTGCNTATSLEGKWVREDGNDFFAESIELFKDGTGIVHGRRMIWERERRDGHNFLQWSFNDSIGGKEGVTYAISGSTLTLDFGDREVKYKKQSGASASGTAAVHITAEGRAAMIEATNKLIAANNEAVQKMQEASARYRNVRNHDQLLRDYRNAFAAYTTTVNAISLDGCDDEFKDTFTAWRQSLVNQIEPTIQMAEFFGSPLATAPLVYSGKTQEERKKSVDEMNKTMRERDLESVRLVNLMQDNVRQVRHNGERFGTVCRYLELDVPFDGTIIAFPISRPGDEPKMQRATTAQERAAAAQETERLRQESQERVEQMRQESERWLREIQERNEQRKQERQLGR